MNKSYVYVVYGWLVESWLVDDSRIVSPNIVNTNMLWLAHLNIGGWATFKKEDSSENTDTFDLVNIQACMAQLYNPYI